MDRAEFENKLTRHFNRLVPTDSTLKKSMSYSLLSPGKRIRPQLVYETSAKFGLSSHLSDPVAFAVEMIHAFSLIHDDLPCMDDDDFRRGLPTNHKVFGEPVALLAGDALLTHAFETFAELGLRVNPAIFNRAFQFFIHSIGVEGIMGGQALELELKKPTVETLLQVQALKTTALFRTSILVPVVIAGFTPDDETYQQSIQFADAFGFAFQALDDITDQHKPEGSKSLLSHFSKDELKRKAKRQLLDSPLTPQSDIAKWLLEQL